MLEIFIEMKKLYFFQIFLIVLESSVSHYCPILFIFYVCYIPQPNQRLLFLSQITDDISIWVIGRDFTLTNKNLEENQKDWKINLNPGKTKETSFQRSKRQFYNCDLSMNESKLKILEKTKFLRILVYDNINFCDQIDNERNTRNGMRYKFFGLILKNICLLAKAIINLCETFLRRRIETLQL